jgi:SAM-dependent methyltransferase
MSDEREPGFGEQAASDYDVMVDWDKRLARELPFFREEFEAAGVERLVDMGCGTGKHAVEFARWGLDVIGVDPAEPMLAQAALNASEAGVDLDLRVGSYGDLADLVDEPVDAVISLGNAFIHVEGPPGARRALEDIAAVLKPGGLVVLHFLNHDRLLAKRPRMMPCRYRETPQGERIFARLYRYDEEDSIGLEFITLQRNEGGDWIADSRYSKHVILPVDSVREAMLQTGFRDPVAYGGHDHHVWMAFEDESVILTARRAG